MNKQIQLYSIDTNAFFTDKENLINKKIITLSVQNKIIKEYTIYQYLFPHKFKCSKFDTYYKNKTRFYELDNNYKLQNDNKDEYKLLKGYFDTIEHWVEDAKKNKVFRTIKSLGKKKEIIDSLDNNELYKSNKLRLPELKKKLKKQFAKKFKSVRVLDTKYLQYKDYETEEIKVRQSNVISEFESYLTRTLGLKEDELTEELFIIDVIHYDILEQLILNGFNHRKERYVAFTASAGQTRESKIVMISRKTLIKHSDAILCGLSVDIINKMGGVNINKYLSYLALVESSTDKWENFDIDRAIVVDDFETKVFGEVDFIDNQTFEIERKKDNFTITHSDGAGMVLSSVEKKPFQFRLNWFKGLLVPVPFLDYCKKVGNYKVKDIYGKEWDLKEDRILYIFSRSQFKMWSFYQNVKDENGNIVKYGWDIYKECFKKYNCHASKCNEAPDIFKNKAINYQMLQSLISMTDDEIDTLIQPSINYLDNAHKDINIMLNIFGVSDNANLNNFQQMLKLYPELLRDEHFRKELKETIGSKKKDFKSGKIKIEAKRTFISPDVFAWLEWLIGRRKESTGELITGGNPNGLLIKGDVYCSLYKNSELLDCLRSPHLYFEHAIRNNLAAIEKGNKEHSKWFCTNVLYTSCHDLISKVLQFDVDGDESLVCADSTIISCASRMIKKYKIRPLYYNMYKADAEIISNRNIYNSLKDAYKYSNIGQNSNRITKLWNVYNLSAENIKDIAKITMINNFQIDAAKTRVVPKQTPEIKQLTKIVDRLEKPHFFKFAKNEEDVAELSYIVTLGEHQGKTGTIKKIVKSKKAEDKVVFIFEDGSEATIEKEDIKLCDSIVNKICSKIESFMGKYDFSKIGRFDYKKLMCNTDIVIDENITNLYEKLNKEKDKWFANSDLDKNDIAHGIYVRIKKELLSNSKYNLSDIVDMLIKHLFINHKDSKKTALIECFGDIIVCNLEINIKRKITDGYFYCIRCNKKTKMNSPTQLYCEKCAKEIRKEKDRVRKKK